ncbi:MAG: magnesium chelatase [Deltaproteobacteria bacterium]|nr:MAG: magnesium chelatase [Pseudomonadota bacterium]PIE65517.1 MAG: magnesium chelatase [Deltaproteobacteria bacterium]
MGDKLRKEQLEQIRALRGTLLEQVRKAFVGPAEIPEMLLVALVARGHVLLEGVPGVAKTTLVKTFSQTLGCIFKRIQFTPDLLPTDITGTYILDMRHSTFVLREGPIFANIVLGDEINRAPAKTQSALLEAMQEAQVTIEGDTRALVPPFMVLATQNPIEQEGTYPLPEAQVDRFLLKLAISYPDAETEKQMLLTYNQPLAAVGTVLEPEQILTLQEFAEEVHIDEELIDYVLGLSRFTREHQRVYLGVSPRASLMLTQAAKARALVHGRGFVLPDDVKALAHPVLAHRILLAPEAELEGVRPAEVISEALDKVRYQRRR